MLRDNQRKDATALSFCQSDIRGLQPMSGEFGEVVKCHRHFREVGVHTKEPLIASSRPSRQNWEMACTIHSREEKQPRHLDFAVSVRLDYGSQEKRSQVIVSCQE
jgi:hypothetical protein